MSIARARIIDPIAFKKYTDRSPSAIAKCGGRVLARGGRFQIMEGPNEFNRFVVIELPAFEQGVECFQSPEYKEAAAFRRSGAEKSSSSQSTAVTRPPKAGSIKCRMCD